jgi:hypothetical protein
MNAKKSREIETAWIPVSAAAKYLGVSRQRIHGLLSEGKLIGKKTDTIWLISLRSCESRRVLLESENGGNYGNW